ncbi:MAG: sugar transferase [Chitinophaga sp.]|uniref:sugar transferase n=1 Tax=Chitinophaga sp. TaxID=1869181 RepID=UPI001B0FDB23|nr:sugar transferase [Chitinophaga sp.]MBO9730973.1 sugar transferase [Chitinophaga sp.]
MNTFTPNVLQVESIRGESRDSFRINTANTESMLLFVGHPHKEMLTDKDEFRCIMASNVEDAKRVMYQLQYVLKKMPAAIIYRFESAYESSLSEWEAFFSTHQFLNTIPFFIYTDKGFEELKSLVIKYPFIDDVITMNAWHMLAGKVAIVSKFKRMRAFPVYKKGLINKKLYTRRFYSNIMKRSLDIVLAGTGLLLLSPLMLLIAALIRLESKGPIFYAAKRAGRNYSVFKFYKFRTMIPDADKQLDKIKHLNQYDGDNAAPVFIKVSNDPRVTKLGSFLRNSSLDELPQLLNVLKGDMSLVGNRPLPLYEATTLTTDDWVERFLAPAGITGLWQVSKRGKKDMSVKERIDLDINYAHKRSFRYDMWLIVNTPLALVQKDNV